MEISKINYFSNRNFGAKFSPSFVSYVKEKVVNYSIEEDKEKQLEALEKYIPILKKYYPEATINIKKVPHDVDLYVFKDTNKYGNPDMEICDYQRFDKRVVIEREGKEDFVCESSDFIFFDKKFLSEILKNLKYIEKEDKYFENNSQAIEIKKRLDKIFA